MILPVVADGLGIGQLPPRLRRYKCADFATGFEKAYALLKRSIEAHLGRTGAA